MKYMKSARKPIFLTLRQERRHGGNLGNRTVLRMSHIFMDERVQLGTLGNHSCDRKIKINFKGLFTDQENGSLKTEHSAVI